MGKYLLTVMMCFAGLELFSQPAWINKAGSVAFEYGNAVCTDLQGNVYVTGQIEDFCTFENITLYAEGGHDFFLAKYNPDGVLQWVKRAGGTDGDIGWGIGTDGSGNIYVSGEFERQAKFENTTLTSAGGTDDNDIFIAKYTPSGDLAWVRQAGGIYHDNSYGLAVTSTGTAYITGKFAGDAWFGPTKVWGMGSNDIFVAKYDSQGNLGWVKVLGGTGEDEGKGIAIDLAENVYITGGFEGVGVFGNVNKTSNGKIDAFVAKLNSSGDVLWVNTAGGNQDDKGRGIAVSNDGSVYYTGEVWDTVSFSGNGGSQYITKGWWDSFTAKYSANGDLTWVKFGGSNNKDVGRSVFIEPSGNILATGEYSGTADFNGTTVQSQGSIDMYLARYSPSGDLLGIQIGGGWHDDAGKGVTADASGNVYLTGYFRETAIFGWTYNMASSGTSDMFVARYNSVVTSSERLLVENNGKIKLYPNPATDHVNIESSSSDPVHAVELFDVMGRRVLATEYGKGLVNPSVSLAGLCSGSYYCTIKTSASKQTLKVILSQ